MGMSSAATVERPHSAAAPLRLVAEPSTRQASVADPLWRVWPGRDWPASHDEELALVADLQFQTPGHEPADGIEPRRGDITALLNALRCGLDAPDLLGRAPGLRPNRLIAAHVALDARRREAVAAWRVIASKPTPEHLASLGDTAAALVPVVIGRLRELGDTDGVELRSLAAACAADIDRVGRLAASVERDMSDPTTPPRRRAGLAALLFGSGGTGLWHHECYLAKRVGTLVPVRVAALLGETATR
ncbi:MAG TPA: hypothetical protein VNO51_02200 [Ilumatobacteraceae bacterium]|nr:hypothetical protein [Ilumatobacteraceae bacterium]